MAHREGTRQGDANPVPQDTRASRITREVHSPRQGYEKSQTGLLFRVLGHEVIFQMLVLVFS